MDEAGVSAVMPMQALQKLGAYRRVPRDAYFGAALTAGKAADCGPCLQLGVSMRFYAAGGVPDSFPWLTQCWPRNRIRFFKYAGGESSAVGHPEYA